MLKPFKLIMYIQPSILLEKDLYRSRTRLKFFRWLTERWECKLFRSRSWKCWHYISYFIPFRSWAVATCLFWAAVLSVTFPRLVGALGVVGAFGFYAGLNVCALVMIFFLMPGTHIIQSFFKIFFLQFSLLLLLFRSETTNSRGTRLRFRHPNIKTYILPS